MLTVGDARALRGLTGKNGGGLTKGRAERLLLLGLVYLREDVEYCYPGRLPAFSPTVLGWEELRELASPTTTKPDAPCAICSKSAREGKHATDLGEGHDYVPKSPTTKGG